MRKPYPGLYENLEDFEDRLPSWIFTSIRDYVEALKHAMAKYTNLKEFAENANIHVSDRVFNAIRKISSRDTNK